MSVCLEELIKKGTRLLELYDRSTERLFTCINSGNMEDHEVESGNRDRLIKDIKRHYLKLEKQIKGLDPSHKDIKMAKNWIKRLSLWIKSISEKDVEILKILEREKKKTQEQITNIFKTRKKIEKYNLNNVK